MTTPPRIGKKTANNFVDSVKVAIFAPLELKTLWAMTFLNQFHKEAMERTMRKIEESKKSPRNSKDFADYMRRNLEQAKKIEDASK